MGKQDWFSNWFDSPYYHILYAKRDEAEAANFIRALQHKLQIPTGAKVLDAACGNGRHAKTLEEVGFSVQGFDLSPSNIRQANVFASQNLTFFVHDIRQAVPEQGSFDVVFNFFTSFGYFDDKADNAKSFQAFAAALKQGGILVVDFLNPTYIRANLVPEEIITRGGIQFHIKRWEENAFLYKSISFVDQGHSYHFEEKVELISKLDFEAYAREAGLSLLDLAGDYQLATFDSKQSPRMIFFWVKK